MTPNLTTQLRKILTVALEEIGSFPHDRLILSGKTINVSTEKSSIAPQFLQKTVKRKRSYAEDGIDNYSSWDLTDPESVMREARRLWAEDEVFKDPEKEAEFNRRQEESLSNPTPEMSRLMSLKATRAVAGQGLGGKEQLADLHLRKARWAE